MNILSVKKKRKREKTITDYQNWCKKKKSFNNIQNPYETKAGEQTSKTKKPSLHPVIWSFRGVLSEGRSSIAEMAHACGFPCTFISHAYQCPGVTALIKGSLDRALGNVTLWGKLLFAQGLKRFILMLILYHILVYIPEYLRASHFTVNSLTI